MQHRGSEAGSGIRHSSGGLSGPLGERRTSGPLSGSSSQALPAVGEGHQPRASLGIRTSGPLPVDPTGGDRQQRSGQVPPPRPTTIADTDLDSSLLQELSLKVLANAGGTLSATAISGQLRLPLNGVLDEALTGLRRDGLIEVATGAAESPRALNM